MGKIKKNEEWPDDVVVAAREREKNGDEWLWGLRERGRVERKGERKRNEIKEKKERREEMIF